MSDKEILDRFYSDRDNQWLGQLLNRYTLLLFGVSMKYLKNEEEAKDAVQQIFLKALTELQKYRVEYFKSWLYMVAKNHCLMKIRDRHGKQSSELKEEMTYLAADDSLDMIHEKDLTLDLMEQSLNELNDAQQECLKAFYLDKKSYQEIAAQSGYPPALVKSHIQNGKRNLRIILEKKLKTRNVK